MLKEYSLQIWLLLLLAIGGCQPDQLDSAQLANDGGSGSCGNPLSNHPVQLYFSCSEGSTPLNLQPGDGCIQGEELSFTVDKALYEANKDRLNCFVSIVATSSQNQSFNHFEWQLRTEEGPVPDFFYVSSTLPFNTIAIPDDAAGTAPMVDLYQGYSAYSGSPAAPSQ